MRNLEPVDEWRVRAIWAEMEAEELHVTVEAKARAIQQLRNENARLHAIITERTERV